MDRKRLLRNPLIWILAAILVYFTFSVLFDDTRGYKQVSTSDALAQIESGNVANALVEDREQRLRLTLRQPVEGSKQIIAQYPAQTSSTIFDALQKASGKPSFDTAVRQDSFLVTMLIYLVPLGIVLLVLFWMMNNAQGGGNRVMSFGKSKAKQLSKDMPKTTFADVAGADEAVEELHEIKDFLQNPARYQALGAKIPKGVLLYGPPGTGKTLLARAVAGEAGVPFYTISGSDFVEMFVGVGASVTGDTPVLVRDGDGTRLVPIGEYVDRQYPDGGSDYPIRVDGVRTLGYRSGGSAFRGRLDSFAVSAWQSVGAVYRHRVDEIYEIDYLGGRLCTTGDHSVFVRGHGGIKAKQARDLCSGDVLVDLPYKTRSGFLPGSGTQHEVRAHEFPAVAEAAVLPMRDVEADEIEQTRLALVRALSGNRPQREVAAMVGVPQMTVSNRARGRHEPRAVSAGYRRTEVPADVAVTPELLKLFGYYTAEGRVSSGVELCFGSHEIDLLADCADLMRRTFGLAPVVEPTTDNFTRLLYRSADLGRFFARHCGNGSHAKHVPELLWTAPREQFLAYLEGYALGDGHQTATGKFAVGKLECTSVSRSLIRELAWLAAMHGIKAGIGHGRQVGGRVIKAVPLPDGEYWRLTIGATSNPFTGDGSRPHKKPVVTTVTRKPYDGYVYDFCGCENEAFFGGDKPVLLHNSRVRDLFEQAKQNSPCIIFVDEIDAVGRQRGAGLGGGHDEREQTLNQLLVEMDGFDARGGIILIAATNRPDILDPALLRPGRFDRQIPVGLPDLAGRRAILRVHATGKPLGPDVDLDSLGKRTVGMSGADLANVVNEGALLTARENGTLITSAALEEAVDRVVGGPRRKGKIISEQERKITAYHEGGHALAAWAMPDLEPVYKLTILPRGRTGGHALVVPEDDKGLMTRSEMIARLVFAMGGRSAEELVFHEPTTGASSDIDQATKIARAMVTEYGMSARLGAVRYGREQGDPFLGRTMGNQADYSLEVAHEIDEEVRALIEAAHTEAWDILNTYRDILDELVFELLERETLTRVDLERIFDRVEKRPRITAFNDFGGRTPSDKPPIQTPAERARERGEPWPPHPGPVHEPTPVGSYPGGTNGVPRPGQAPLGPTGGPVPPGQARPGQPPFPAAPPHPGGRPAQPGWAPSPSPGAGQHRPAQPSSVPHNYGAPPDWRPATTPPGQSWPPAGQWQPPPGPWPQPGPQPWPGPPADGNGHADTGPEQESPDRDGAGPIGDGSR